MADSINAIIGELEKFTEKLCRNVIRTFVQGVRERNPVWTGHSRANWITTTGGPAAGEVGERRFGAVDTVAAEASLAEFESSWTLHRGNVYVTNNVAYVNLIEAGVISNAKGYVMISVLDAVTRGAAESVR